MDSTSLRAGRREVFYLLTAVHAMGDRVPVGTYRRRVEAASDGAAICRDIDTGLARFGWSYSIERVSRES